MLRNVLESRAVWPAWPEVTAGQSSQTAAEGAAHHLSAARPGRVGEEEAPVHLREGRARPNNGGGKWDVHRYKDNTVAETRATKTKGDQGGFLEEGAQNREGRDR